MSSHLSKKRMRLRRAVEHLRTYLPDLPVQVADVVQGAITSAENLLSNGGDRQSITSMQYRIRQCIHYARMHWRPHAVIPARKSVGEFFKIYDGTITEEQAAAHVERFRAAAAESLRVPARLMFMGTRRGTIGGKNPAMPENIVRAFDDALSDSEAIDLRRPRGRRWLPLTLPSLSELSGATIKITPSYVNHEALNKLFREAQDRMMFPPAGHPLHEFAKVRGGLHGYPIEEDGRVHDEHILVIRVPQADVDRFNAWMDEPMGEEARLKWAYQAPGSTMLGADGTHWENEEESFTAACLRSDVVRSIHRHTETGHTLLDSRLPASFIGYLERLRREAGDALRGSPWPYADG